MLGVGKSERYNHFTFEKKQAFFAGFRNFLLDLYFEDSDKQVSGFARPKDKEGYTLFDQNEDIRKYKDRHFHFASGIVSLNIFFGDKKIFLVIHTERDIQEDVMNSLLKFSELKP